MRGIALGRTLALACTLTVGCWFAEVAEARAACDRAGGEWLDVQAVPGLATPRANPLIGQVYDTRTSASFDPCPERALGRLAGVLRASLAQPPALIVLGEVHDNPSVHALRAALIEEISGPAGTRLRPALVFEHVRTDRQPVFDAINTAVAAATPPTVANVFETLEWSKSGWPDQSMFAPMFAVALAAKLPLVAGDVPRASMSAVSRQGLDAVPADDRARLHLDTPQTPALQNDLLTDLEASHCGLMPKQAFTNMAVAQRLRDATLAASWLAAAERTGSAILLAGNEHARRDRGAPSYLQPESLRDRVLSVMFLEVEDGNDDPAAYVPKDPDGKPTADVIVFVPRTVRPDPCIEMRKQFAKPAPRP